MRREDVYKRQVEGHVADDDIFLSLKGRALGRIDDEAAAGQALAKVVVAVPLQFQGQALGDEGAEALAAAAVAVDGVVALRQGVMKPFGDLVAQDGAHGPVGVAHRGGQRLGLPLFQGGTELFQQLHVQCLFQLKVIDILEMCIRDSRRADAADIGQYKGYSTF